MIRTQLKLFPEKIKKREIKKGQQTKRIIIRQSSSRYFRQWNETVSRMAKTFTIPDRKYYAGMTDGDGSIKIKGGKGLRSTITLELRHDRAEPVLKIAEIFDLTISRKIYLIPKGNTQPSLIVEFGGMKAKLFMFCIYPYLLEEKEAAEKWLLARDCSPEYLPKERQFSFEYLAGYTDAEGSIYFTLKHTKLKSGNTSSHYVMYYVLTSNDNAHLQFIKKNLIELGFDHFRKDFVNPHTNDKKVKGRNPENWKPTTNIYLGGTPTQLSAFYKNIEPFMMIKHKKDNMLSTIKYNQVITMNQ